MLEHLRTFAALQPGLTASIVERAQQFSASGQVVHHVGVRRWGDDDDDLGFLVLVDPVLNGAEQYYEAREGEDAELWDLSEDGPSELQEIVTALTEAHEDSETESYPGRSMSEPHAIFTSMLDSLAQGLARDLGIEVSLLDTEAIPFVRHERDEVRDWVAAQKARNTP